MAAASASAILTVPDRPVAERPDTRTSDAADGRFAGLMAQITQRPGPQRPPEQARPTPVRTEDEPRAEASESAPTEATKPLTMPRKPAAKADPSGPKAEAPDVQQNPGATAPVSVPPPTTPVAAVPSPAAVKAEPVPTLTEEKPVPEAMALKTALATSAEDPNGPATQALKGLPTTPQVAITVAASAPSPTPSRQQTEGPSTSPEAVQAQPLPTPGDRGISIRTEAPSAPTPLPRVTPLPITATAMVAPQMAVQPASQATPSAPTAPASDPSPQIDPVQLPAAAVVQAVLAEPAPRVKGAQEPEPPSGLTAAPKADAPHPTLPVTKPVEGQPVPAEPRASLQAAPSPKSAAAVQETNPATNHSSAAAAPSSEPAPAAPELQVAKANPTAQAPVFRGTDGSALAALTSVPRVQTAPVAATPTAPLAAAPTPTAPVAQVEGGLRWMLKGGAQEAQLQLHPDSLGQVTIHLKVEGGEVHARLWVTEPASVQAVQEGRPHLELSLKEQGLHLGSFDLQQGHRPFQEAPSAPTYRERTEPEVLPARQEAPAAILPTILNPHHVELYA